MKNRITKIPSYLLLFAICICVFLSPVFAASEQSDGLSSNGKNNPGGVDTSQKVYDYAQLLTQEDIQAISDQLIKTGEKRKTDLVIVTTNDTKGRSSRDYADDFFDYNGFGYGANKDGVLMLIDMENRNVWISTTGKAIQAINSDRIDHILDDVAPSLSSEDYREACLSFIKKTNHYLLEDQFISPQTFLIFVGISLAVGAIGVFIMICCNKLVKKGTQAGAYLSGNLNLTAQNDVFLRSSVTRTAIPKNTSSGGGGGSHTGSSGTSHGGGGRSF